MHFLLSVFAMTGSPEAGGNAVDGGSVTNPFFDQLPTAGYLLFTGLF